MTQLEEFSTRQYTIIAYDRVDFSRQGFQRQYGEDEWNRIKARLHKIADEGHFGDHKSVEPPDSRTHHPAVRELRTRSGMRVYYYTREIGEEQMFIILEIGNKSSQGRRGGDGGDIAAAIAHYDEIEGALRMRARGQPH